MNRKGRLTGVIAVVWARRSGLRHLKQIAVSDRTTLGGLSQFLR
jgi:hypothetical protein